MNNGEARVCTHCGIRFSRSPVVEDHGEHAGAPFCCRGCRGAYRIITGAGLDGYYQRGGRITPTVDDQLPAIPDDAELAPYLIPCDDVCRIDFLIGGISCPSCQWLLERVIGRIDGVDSVSLSYSSASASVKFNPEAIGPSQIAAEIARLGYRPRPYSPDSSEKEAREQRMDLLVRCGTGLFLTMQLMAYSFGLYAGYFQGMSPFMHSVLQYFSLAVSTPVVFYCGWPFWKGAWQGIRSRQPGMDLLIVVGAGSAWLYSGAALLAGAETYFESAAMIVAFVLIGRLLEQAVRRRALEGVEALYAAVPQKATILEGEIPREVDASLVRAGQALLVRQGERVPVDMLITEGETEIDQALVSGESVPVMVGPGSELRAGSVNLLVPVRGEALRPAGLSYPMRVAEMVRTAQASRPEVQRVADRISSRFVPSVITLGVAVFCWLWLVSATTISAAVMTGLAVVLIACPCALGLAVPTAVLAACSRAAASGVLIRGGDVIERLSGVDTVLLDKTGTLTEGRPAVTLWGWVGDFPQDQLLEAVATVESLSSHPVAGALVQYAAERGILPQLCSDFRSFPGRGVAGRLPSGIECLCGSPAMMEERGIDTSPLSHYRDDSESLLAVAVGGRLAGWFLVSDRLRSGAAAMVSGLAATGLALEIVSGDAPPVVSRLARELGIAAAAGGMTPSMKLERVNELHRQGHRVLMVGDGVNDTPSLAASLVSCSIQGSSDSALEQADLIVPEQALAGLFDTLLLSRRAMGVIRQNLAWSFFYNLIGIPLALAGVVTPVYAAGAMTVSSLMVSCNSLRLMKGGHHG